MHLEDLQLTEKKLVLTADIEDIIRRKATPTGNGAHVTCPKEYVGRTIYLVVCRE
ncbi:MAG: DUF2080 family transposase-associated protein [Candidatus Bathyarchaeota archaeon]|jgi:putative transposon-encoded protein|nr:DUF2080 family transposase-associated protein [Candidatus Bathyarchaeota archaeon]